MPELWLYLLWKFPHFIGVASVSLNPLASGEYVVRAEHPNPNNAYSRLQYVDLIG
jgi:hypothetical protein